MKFLNLRKLKNIALAVLIAAAVLFVMPVTAFADDDTDCESNIDAISVTINNENDEEIESDAALMLGDTNLYSAEEETESLCLGVCCDLCDENCNGFCCPSCDKESCTIIKNKEAADNESEGEAAENKADIDNSDGIDDAAENNDAVYPAPAEPNVPNYTDDYYDTNIYENNYDFNPFENLADDWSAEEESADDYDDGTGVELTESESEDIILDDEEELPEEIIFDDDLLDDEYSDEFEDIADEELEEVAELPEEEENQDNSDDEDSDDSADMEDLDSSDDENTNSLTNDEDTDNLTEDENSDDSEDEAEDNQANDDKDAENFDTDDAENVSDEEESDDLEKNDNPIINVVLPASLSVVVNPYNLKTDNTNGDFYYSILSPEYAIKNYSNCDVSIVTTVSASTTGGVVLSPYNLTGNETDFTAFVYLEAINEGGMYSDDYYDNANQIVFTNSASSKEILLLADGSNGETTGYFKIKGLSVIPDDVYFSSQALINMVITFDISPVGKSTVSDAADPEDFDSLDAVDNSEEDEVGNSNDDAVDNAAEDEAGNSNDDAVDNSAEDETGNSNDDAVDNAAEDEAGNSNDDAVDNAAEDEAGNSNDEAVDNAAEDETGNSNDETVDNSAEDEAGNSNDEIFYDSMVESGYIYDDTETENMQEIIL